MPNWVFNHITVRKKDVARIVNKDGDVDFELLLPMPKELEDK